MQTERLTSFTEVASCGEKASLKIKLIWGHKQKNAVIIIL